MVEDLDTETIVEFIGVFAAALLGINAFDHLMGAIARGDVIGNELALLSGIVLVALFVGLVLQQRY